MRDVEEQRTPFGWPVVDDHWPPADREFAIDLNERPPKSPSGRAAADHAVLANGSVNWRETAKAGEVVRLHLANAAPSRSFRLRLPGARVKLIGSGAGRVEREEFIDEVLLVPGDRAVVDVLFEQPGERRLEHRSPGRSLTVAILDVASGSGPTRAYAAFARLRTNPELARLRRALTQHLPGEPDATLATGALTSGPDRALGTTGPRPMLRLINDASLRRPRQHLVRLEGGRCVVLSRDGVQERNLAWTDALLIRAGEVVDALVEPTGLQTLHLLVRDVETPGAGGTLRLHVGR